MIRNQIIPFFLLFWGVLGAQSPVSVADQTFQIEGEHNFYYAFAKDDQIHFSLQLLAGRKVKTIELISLPDQVLFRSIDLDSAFEKTITAPQTGVYQLHLTEKGVGKKICRFQLWRTPGSNRTARMDTHVAWDVASNPAWTEMKRSVPAGKKTDLHTISGQVRVPATGIGLLHSRTSYRFDLPENTVRWAYRIGVAQSVQEARRKDAERLRDLTDKGATKLMAIEPQTALAAFALGMAVQMTTSTAGEDVEYAITDLVQLKKFLEGSNQYDAYIWQGSVSVDAQKRYSPLSGSYAFALKNNNLMDDIDVAIDIEVVTETPLFEEEIYLVPQQP